jgi:hypothetical protein
MVDNAVNAGDAVILRSEHGAAEGGPERIQSTDMVMMVVGDENRLNAQAVGNGGKHRAGITRINYDAAPLAATVTPDVVVFESRQRVQNCHGR